MSHWASEWLWLDAAAEQLREALPGSTVTVSELRTDPWDFAVVHDQPEGTPMALKAAPAEQALLLDLQALDTKLRQLDHRA